MTNTITSLSDLLGKEYLKRVCEAKAFIEQKSLSELSEIANEKVEFIPSSYLKRVEELVKHTGEKVIIEFNNSQTGATTTAFRNAASISKSPLSAFGATRIGEDGRAYLIAKSEHYHTPLGHSFPGYKLIENANKLGIPNATHNNTRGYITRLLERELVRIVNSLDKGDNTKLEDIIASEEPQILNRVINLETGSLAVEAALKMMLARFFRLEKTGKKAKYEGKIPVFFVMADNTGGNEANYHGTTVLTQTLRGLWPGLYEKLEKSDIYRVVSVGINDLNDLTQKIEKYNIGKFKVAGFFHEIVLMNYGGITLTKDYLSNAYSICHNNDIPVLVDEIQSCLWSPDFFMFKEYGLNPDFVSVGKGFPGGQYPASKLITTSKMDNLNLFGALVTNGQEELASLSYLVTMKFAETNRKYTKEIGDYYEDELKKLNNDFNSIIDKIEGSRHMSTIFFKTPEEAIKFTKEINQLGIDISVQTYKANCPPAALTKLPLITTKYIVDFVIETMRKTLNKISDK